MTFPEKLPIARMEDYHTHYLGKTGDGRLFWGYETFAYSPPISQINDNNWRQYRFDYAVLHLFDNEGNYLSSKSFTPGKGVMPKGAIMTEKIEEWVAGLGAFTYCDIEIKLFQTIIDGLTFGLIPNSNEHFSIDLEPSSTISFQEPWDGEYYT
jgi:formate hydrogenlyase regulatory protein HycA